MPVALVADHPQEPLMPLIPPISPAAGHRLIAAPAAIRPFASPARGS